MLRGLESDDEAVVVEAIEELQASSDPGAIEALIRLIARARHTEWAGERPYLASTIPEKAAHAVAVLAGRSAIRTLILIAADDPAQAFRFEGGLRFIDPDWRQSHEAQQALSDLLSRQDVTRYATALAWIGDARAVPILLPHLADPEIGIAVRQAIRLLDNDWWKNPEVENQVKQECAKLTTSAADEAIRKLTKIGSPDALESLLQIVADENHPSRSEAELAFFQIVSWPESAAHAERLLKPLLADKTLRLRLFAANALRTNMERRSADLLNAWKVDSEYLPRLVASRLLEKLGLESGEIIQPVGETPFCFSCGEQLTIAPLPDYYTTPSAGGQFPLQPPVEDRPRAGSVCPSCDRILCWICVGGPEAATCPVCDAALESAMPERCSSLIQRLQPYWA